MEGWEKRGKAGVEEDVETGSKGMGGIGGIEGWEEGRSDGGAVDSWVGEVEGWEMEGWEEMWIKG